MLPQPHDPDDFLDKIAEDRDTDFDNPDATA
jgi:hypothetical protein